MYFAMRNAYNPKPTDNQRERLWRFNDTDNNKRYWGLHVKCPIFLLDFDEIWILWTELNKSPKYKISLKSVQWEPHWRMRANVPENTFRGRRSRFEFPLVGLRCVAKWPIGGRLNMSRISDLKRDLSITCFATLGISYSKQLHWGRCVLWT